MKPIFSCAALLALAVACSSGRAPIAPSNDGGAGFVSIEAEEEEDYDADDFWENDPPPEWCGPGKAPASAIPGGTPECPDDKNKEGCPCPKVGEEAACWPGLRKHRKLGICKDGVTTCMAEGEFGRVWGPCKGAVKPRRGATKGKEACGCFSQGKWDIDNIVPCFVEVGAGKYAAVSTIGGQCPSVQPGQMPSKPSGSWTKNRLTVDCAGRFELCYTIRAGAVDAPSPSDCVVAQVCTEGDYATAGKVQSFPDLPHWVTSNTTCATRFFQSGGYSEMSVTGQSVRCDEISDDGEPLVFQRNGFCPMICSSEPSRPECQSCVSDATGEF